MGLGKRLRFERYSDLMKDQDRLDIRGRGEREERMTAGFLTWVSNQTDHGTINRDTLLEGEAGLGENVTDTVGGLTCHPILHPI